MKLFVKRLIDILLSVIGVLILMPFWLITSLVVLTTSKGPVLYIHKRVGLDGQEFNCYKFRSMKVGVDKNTLVSTPDDSRLTVIGKFLRKTSLDETPQLINVFLGSMSIVGPRPALPSQVLDFTKEELDKLLVKPGLTGWTQVNGRNSISYKNRMELDCWYAKNWSLLLDLKILFKTLFVIFRQEGIYDVK